MTGSRTSDSESQVRRPNHSTTEPCLFLRLQIIEQYDSIYTPIIYGRKLTDSASLTVVELFCGNVALQVFRDCNDENCYANEV